MTERGVQQPQESDAAFELIAAVGTLAHDYGVSSYRLQALLHRLAAALGFEGHFTATPSAINFALWSPGDRQQRSHVATLRSSNFDLGRMAELSQLVDRIEQSELSVAQARARLDEIDGNGSRPARYKAPIVGLGYALAGAGFAVLMSAQWWDALFAGLVSLLVFGLTLSTTRMSFLARRLELTSGAAAAVAADSLARLAPGSDPVLITLCGLVVLLPGYSLTMGTAELSARMVVSGLERFMGGVMTLLSLFIGGAVATIFLQQLFGLSDVQPTAGSPGAWPWLFAAVLTAGLAIIFKVRRQDFFWAVLGGVIAYGGSQLGASFGYWQGSFIGALLVGLYASLFAWRLRRPMSIVLITAIMVLVPGGSALLGLEAGLDGGAAGALSAEWHTLANVGAILAGLMTAHAILPAKSLL